MNPEKWFNEIGSKMPLNNIGNIKEMAKSAFYAGMIEVKIQEIDYYLKLKNNAEN